MTVGLSRTFADPVVVCTIRYNANSIPVVPRVSNVTATSFDVRLQNPSGGVPVADTVSYLVVEEGTWTIDGVNIEAQTYLSTVTDENNSWVGETQAYGQAYTGPVVLGQVMSENDADWSIFWCRGGSSTSPPSPASLRVGKTVGEDSDETRADETVGFIVVETGHGTLNGVEYEAALGGDSIQGIDNNPPDSYTFDTAFASAPQVGLANVAGMDGNNGGWAVLYGATPTTATVLNLAIDEDQTGDSERNHTTENVGYLVFERPVLYPNQAPDDPAGLGLTECPQGGGTDKTPSLHFTQAEVEGDEVSFRVQIDDTDGSFSSLVVDYTSEMQVAGAATFTVGQAAGGGSYGVGAEGQELSAGIYYWRVHSDDGFATSSWVTGASFTIVEPTADFSAGGYAMGEGDGTATITVEISQASCQTIAVDYDSSDDAAVQPDDYGAVSGTLTFSPGESSKTFDVTAVDDFVDEDDETVTLTLSNPVQATLAGANNPAVLTITDDDTAGVSIAESGGSTDVVEGGATDTYTILLESSPTADVTITVTPDAQTDLGAGAGAPVQRVFTTGNWSVAQVVNVAAVDDDFDEGPHTSAITHSVDSGDGNYGGIGVGGVTAAITDDDVSGVTMTETAGSTAVTEGGATDSYTVVLDSRPTGNVTVTVDPDGQTDLGGGPGTAIDLIFSPTDWSVARMVTVAAVDDSVAEGLHVSAISHSSASIDPNYDGIDLSGSDVSVTITDDDVGGVTLTESGGTTSVIETGATDSYTIVLDTKPTADVVITIDPDEETDVGSGRDAPIELTFTPSNWSAPQVVIISAFDDAIDEGGHTSTITHSAAGSDPVYDGIVIADLIANVGDDDVAGVTIVESGASTAATEGGATDAYTVVLDSQPVAEVTITLMPDHQADLGGGAGAAIQLLFNAGNWGAAQTVTVTAADDDVDEDAHLSTIDHTAASADGEYDGLAISDVVASITDNDTAGVTITESAGSTDLVEGGAGDTYEVVLNTEPVGGVTVTVDPDPQASVGSGPGGPVQFNFDAGNWSVARTVTVTAVDDSVAEGVHFSTIVHSAAGTDAKYDGMDLSGEDVVASIADDDLAGVTIVESGGLTAVAESGTSDTYTLVLDSEPSANVVVTIAPDAQADLGAGRSIAVQRTFTPADWSTPQLVTVGAFNDFVAEGAHTSTISHGAASGDAGYDGIAIADVIADITDNDSAGVIVTQTAGGTAVAEGGSTDGFAVALSSEPTAEVTVLVDPDVQTGLGSGYGTAVALVFDTANWSVAQALTVAAADDFVDEGAHTSTITLTVSSGDGGYDGIGVADVIVDVSDNDSAGIVLIESGGSTEVTEGGAGDAYTVVLESQPVDDVTITVTPDAGADVGAGAGAAIVLTFTDADWDIPQVVSVTGADDDVQTGDRSSTVAHAVASGDANYDGMVLNNIVAAITEDDAAGVVVAESDGATEVTEGGVTDSYTLALSSEPLSDVVITITPDAQTDLGAGAGLAVVRTFTAANWMMAQTIVVAAVDDATYESTHSSFIMHSVDSGDAHYQGIAAAGVTVVVYDNDASGGGPDPPPPGDEDPADDGDGDADQEPGEPDPPPPADGDDPRADVRLSIDSSAVSAFVGEEVLLYVRVRNEGEAAADGLIVTLQLSNNGELLFVRRLEQNGADSEFLLEQPVAEEFSFSVGRVAAGEVVTLELGVRATGSGVLAVTMEAGTVDAVVSQETAEIEIEDIIDVVIVTHRSVPFCGAPGCGAAGLPVLLILVGLMGSRYGATSVRPRHAGRVNGPARNDGRRFPVLVCR